jgi:hypothetical protein
MIEFKCSQCGEGMESPQSLAGQVVKCPKCEALRRVPEQARPVTSAKSGKPLWIVVTIIGLIAAAGVGGYLVGRQSNPNGTTHEVAQEPRPTARASDQPPVLAPATAAPAHKQTETGGPADETKKAIAEHRLTNGMTVAEAEKALDVKFMLIADGSGGTTYRAAVTDKAMPNPNSGAIYTGTDYTITIRGGVISSWSSRRYFIGRDGLSHDQQ